MSLSACARIQERSTYLRGPKTSLSDYQDIALKSATSETEVLRAFSEHAGLKKNLPEKTSDDWQLVVRAGMNAINEQCEKYMDSIFWADRDLRTAGDEINLAGATTATLLGVFAAPGAVIAATAAAFGFGTQGITNYSRGLFYDKVQPSGIRKIVERSQATYQQGVEERMKVYRSRPAAVAAIQGYLSLCLPASIETQINEAVAASAFELVKPKPADKDAVQSPVPQLKRVATEESPAATVETVRRDLEKIITGRVPPTPKIPEADQPKECRAHECLLTKSKAKKVQEALCLDEIDGNFGPKTRDAIAAFEASGVDFVDKHNRQLEDKERSTLEGIGPCKAPFKNALERFRYGDSSNNYRAPLPRKVKILIDTMKDAEVSFTDPTPITFDTVLRDVIGQVQRDNNQEPTKQVTKELLDALQSN